MNVTSFRIHDDQVELLDTLCDKLRCSRSFFIRQLIDNCSSDLFEKIHHVRLKNEAHRITSLGNRTLLKSLRKPYSNFGVSHKTKNKPTKPSP